MSRIRKMNLLKEDAIFMKSLNRLYDPNPPLLINGPPTAIHITQTLRNPHRFSSTQKDHMLSQKKNYGTTKNMEQFIYIVHLRKKTKIFLAT
jgi:hypothetical protein